MCPHVHTQPGCVHTGTHAASLWQLMLWQKGGLLTWLQPQKLPCRVCPPLAGTGLNRPCRPQPLGHRPLALGRQPSEAPRAGSGEALLPGHRDQLGRGRGQGPAPSQASASLPSPLQAGNLRPREVRRLSKNHTTRWRQIEGGLEETLESQTLYPESQDGGHPFSSLSLLRWEGRSH